MAWTNEMIDSLKEMWKKGLTTNEIAKELGVSKNSIIGKVHRLNLTARPSPIKKKEKSTPKSMMNVLTQKSEAVSDEGSIGMRTSSLQTKSYKHTCIKLSELDSHTCRWPIGDPKDENFCFCGKKVRAGETYCDEHAEIAYVKPGKK